MSADPLMRGFIGGALTVGFLVAALFFLKFWRRTDDRLFLMFAAAFVLLSANHAAPIIFDIPSENQAPVFLLRLAGFALIIWAILGKNLARR